jgi:hypothetical protein
MVFAADGNVHYNKNTAEEKMEEPQQQQQQQQETATSIDNDNVGKYDEMPDIAKVETSAIALAGATEEAEEEERQPNQTLGKTVVRTVAIVFPKIKPIPVPVFCALTFLIMIP